MWQMVVQIASSDLFHYIKEPVTQTESASQTLLAHLDEMDERDWQAGMESLTWRAKRRQVWHFSPVIDFAV